uniref:Geranyl diphosphate synthase n=1 Tax=Ips pini TaxID=102803 RepID=GPPS_IPSPI|nr:RecName: Full=Geranyl diphosphate synthase [Ips pini]AAX55632.1 geranyl diphosphate synthase [Ips pini]
MFKLAQRLPKSVSSLGSQLSKNAPNQLAAATTSQLINTPGIRHKSRSSAVPSSLSKSMYDHNEEMKAAMKYMDEIYPEVMGQIEKVPQYEEIKPILVRLREAIDYTVPYGKRFKGVHIVSHFKLLADPKFITPENVKLSGVLGWCAEIIQAYFCMLDDIMDDSDTRRGKPTWYKLPGIGLNAVTDVCLMEMFTFELLKRYFPKHPSYADIHEILRNLLFLTHMGQGYDFTFIDPVTRKINFNDFTEENYTKLCRYKIIFSTFHNTLELTSAMANVYDPKKIKQLDPVLMRIGMMHQSQNDFKDLYRDQGEVLKQAEKSVLGTDIKTGQLTWFAQKALSICNDRQRKIIMDNYGKEDNKNSEAVREVYEELDLKGKFMEFEEESFEWLKKEIPKINNGIPHKVFQDYTYGVFKRRPE